MDGASSGRILTDDPNLSIAHFMIEHSEAAPSDKAQVNTTTVADGTDTARGNWVEAIFGLIESRSAIISLEAKDALGNTLAKLVPFVVCVFCVFATWALVVVATIGGLASATLWKWHQITFAMAALHLIIALIARFIAKKQKPAPFPVTRSEFEKDREWLIHLKNRNN
jgi:uncharacterized membrane protein YqjE